LTTICWVAATTVFVKFTADTVPMSSMHKKAQNSTRFMIDSSINQ
jgi:hypothetical protein